MPFISSVRGSYGAQGRFSRPPAPILNFAQNLAALPQRDYMSGLSGTVPSSIFTSSSDALGSMNNTLYYTTLYAGNNSALKYNAIMIMSYPANTTGSNSRSSTGGHNSSNMITYGNGYSSSESWIGTQDAEKLIFAGSSAYRAVLGAVGNVNEIYFTRDTGVGASTIFDRITQTEGTDWSQNRTTKSFANAISNTGYSLSKANGPWGSGHYGPWGWDTSNTTSGNTTLRGTRYGQGASSNVFIFERDDANVYPPSDSHSMFVFYPQYPCV
jgi:hypothetical protein